MEQDEPNELETLLARVLAAQLVPVSAALDSAATKLETLQTLATATAAGVARLGAKCSELEALATSAESRLDRIENRLAPLELVSGFIAANTTAANVTKLAQLEARILVLEQQRRSS